MKGIVPRYSKEEYARRGNTILERDVVPKAAPEDKGKYVAIDIESGDFEVDSDDYAACERLFQRHPDAQMWMARVGYRTAYTMLSMR